MSSSMRRMRHSAETISSTSMNSTWSTGRKRARWLLRRLSNSRRSSQARTTVCAVAPCLTAFWLEAALPCSVRGPVEDSEFCRLARICAGVDMRGLLYVFIISREVQISGGGGRVWFADFRRVLLLLGDTGGNFQVP